MQFSTHFTQQLAIQHPVIMAPMFLVSNVAMMKAGMDNGVMATFPSLNFRNKGELAAVLSDLNSYKAKGVTGNYGVNLIVQQTNPLYKTHLNDCVTHKVPLLITSLGSPKEVIEQVHAYGGKVLCDVTNLLHAQKCYELGCDGFIAVGAGAGGHAGPNALHVLVPALKNAFPDKPTIAAGGISHGSQIAAMLLLGAEGVSIGTRFIACTEASVSEEYKMAIVESKMDDIVLSEKISGTPCAIINTPYAKKIGYKQNWLERQLNTNKTLKKYYKMLVQLKGMRKMQQSVKPGSYQTLWSAGQSVEFIEKVDSIETIVNALNSEMNTAIQTLNPQV